MPPTPEVSLAPPALHDAVLPLSVLAFAIRTTREIRETQCKDAACAVRIDEAAGWFAVGRHRTIEDAVRAIDERCPEANTRLGSVLPLQIPAVHLPDHQLVA